MDSRSPDRIRAHYEIERELSDRLREAPAERRLALYGEVYDELFERVPDHPMLSLAADGTARDANVEAALPVPAGGALSGDGQHERRGEFPMRRALS